MSRTIYVYMYTYIRYTYILNMLTTLYIYIYVHTYILHRYSICHVLYIPSTLFAAAVSYICVYIYTPYILNISSTLYATAVAYQVGHLQRNLFKILSNQAEIRLYLLCTDYHAPNQSMHGKYNLISV